MKTPETPQEWLERYEKKRDKAYQNYQETGIQKYDREFHKYDQICEAFHALIQHKEERKSDIKKRITNKNAVIDNLLLQKYSRAEVIKMLNEAVYW